MNECFYYRVITNSLKASLVLHTRQLKELDNEKNQNKTLSGIETVKAVRLKTRAEV